MLQVQVLREETNRVIDGLKKRNFKDADSLVNEAILIDKNRKEVQKQADDLKAKSNIDSKKVGELMKAGKTEEANAIKSAVALDKQNIKSGEGRLEELEKKTSGDSLQNS